MMDGINNDKLHNKKDKLFISCNPISPPYVYSIIYYIVIVFLQLYIFIPLACLYIICIFTYIHIYIYIYIYIKERESEAYLNLVNVCCRNFVSIRSQRRPASLHGMTLTHFGQTYLLT